MAERARDSSWLLSDEARPAIEIPAQDWHVERRFRMPTCIGKPPRYGIAGATPAPELVSDGRFRDRTLAWFDCGEEQAIEECAEFEAVARPSRRLRAIAIGIGSTVAVVATVVAMLLSS
jgi:hypothetical protein